MGRAVRFGSVCSGIEAASVAWHPLGWRAAFVSEIEPFPCAVLEHHYPAVSNHGDMTKFEEWPDAALDVLVGGTPCQSFSVAGLRGGLADPRGNLMLTFGAIARRYRPTWLVWENVPGVLSSNGGRDFGTFLGMLAELGYGFAYRVLDAQFFGVAQRRRRVFVVGCLGDWRRAAAVLFERDSLSGNPAPSREARQDAAGSTGDGIARCLTTGEAKRQDWETRNFVAHSLRGEGFDASEDGTGRGTPLVPVSVALRGRDGGATAELGDEVAFTLRASEGGGDKPHVLAHAFDARQADVIQYGDKTGPLDTDGGSIGVLAFDTTQVTSVANRSNPKPGDPCHPLAAGAHAPAIAFSPCGSTTDAGDIAPTMRKREGGASGHGQGVAVGMSVRRLTPVECARLQGFPDTYLDIIYRGKPAADGPKYKALGNSMAVPVMAWLGRRIAMVDALKAERVA